MHDEQYNYEELRKLPRHAKLMKWDKSDLACHSIKYQSIAGKCVAHIAELESNKDYDYANGEAGWVIEGQDKRIAELKAKIESMQVEHECDMRAMDQREKAIKRAIDIDDSTADLKDILLPARELRTKLTSAVQGWRTLLDKAWENFSEGAVPYRKVETWQARVADFYKTMQASHNDFYIFGGKK